MNLPVRVNEECRRSGAFVLLELGFLVVVVMGCILLVQGNPQDPCPVSKPWVVGTRQYGGNRQFIPLKINAGVSCHLAPH